MKKIYQILVLISFLYSNNSVFAQANNNGFYESYIIINGTYYDLGANTGNPDFSGSPAALSALTCGNFTLNGFEAKLFKCGSCNVTNVRLFYSIYQVGATPTFRELGNNSVNNIAGAGAGCTNQQWQNTNANIDLISTLTLPNGNYIFEVFTRGTGEFCANGDFYDTNFNGNNNFKVNITVNNPIAITTQPTISTVCYGSNTSLSASATGADTYYWQKQNGASWTPVTNGSIASGATTTLNLTNVTTTEVYRCLFTNCGGVNELTTSPITVTPQQPSITAQPISQTDCEGNSMRYVIIATGTGSLSYQWQRKKPSETSFSDVSTTIDANIKFPDFPYVLQVQPTGGANPHLTEFRCIVKDANQCTVTSSSATLSLNSMGDLSDASICANGTYTMTVPTVGNVKAYRWQRSSSAASGYTNMANGVLPSGSTAIPSGVDTQTLTLSNCTSSDNNTYYRCVIDFFITTPNDNTNGSATNNNNATDCTISSTIRAKVSKLTISTVPSTPTVTNDAKCGTNTVLLSASGAGTGQNYKWYSDNIIATPFQTNVSTYSPTLSATTDYYVSIYNTASPFCESARVKVTGTINPIPTITFGSVTDICNSATSFSLPFSATTGSPNQYSISVGSPALSGFSAISNATLGSLPIDVTIPVNATPNTYQFSISVKNSSTTCASNDQTFTVKINDTPAAPTVTSPINYCQNITTTALSATATGSNTLLWYGTSASGGTSSASAPTPSSASLGTTIYYVSQKNSYACESTRAAISVVVNAVPTTPSATTAVAYCKNATATALSATASGSNSLVWYDENDNILASAPTPNTATVGTQIFKVSQKSPAPANCESPKTTITVTVNDLPSAPTVTTPIAYCQNGTASALSATASGSNTLLWYGTNAVGGTSSGTAPTPLTTTAGTTSYYVSQKDANNCESPRTKIDVEITPSVTATITGINAFCITGVLNSSTTLTANPTGGNNTYTYQWQNLAGNIASATNQTFDVNSTVQLANSDTYKVTVTSGNCTATANLTVTRQGWSDVPSVLVSPIGDICGSGTKTLNIVSPSASGTYKWYADATTLTQTAAGTSFSTPNLTSTTTYYVAREQQITANLTCQTVRTATTINVSAIPETPIIVNSANKITLCNNESGFTLSTTCASGSEQYRLNNGSWISGNSVTIAPSTYTSITTLNYDFKCTLSASCESGIASTSISINPVPNAPTISGNTSICAGSSTTLTANGCTGTVVWSNGTSANSITVSAAGTYNATCTVNACVSVASLTQTVVVNQNPTITLSAVNSICNAATTFDLSYTTTTNNPDKYSLISTMPDFVAVAETNLSASPIVVTIPSGKTGTHNFTLNIKNNTTGCINSQSFNITILPALLGGSIEPSSSTINCAGYNPGEISSVTLASGGKTDYVYQWQLSTDNVNFTDVSGANSILYNPPSAISQTTYYRRKVTDACGAEAYSSNVHQVQIVADPQITLTDASERVICSGESINLTATVIGGSGTCVATWQSSSTLSGTYANEQVGGLSLTQSLTNTSSTALVKYYQVNYACSGTGSSACGQSTSPSIKVTVNYIPNAPIVSGSTIICAGSSTTLTASGCAGTINWNTGAAGSTISASIAGTYSATCTQSGCTSSASNILTLIINPIPNPPTITSDDADKTVCAGTSVVLTASACAGTVVWSNNTTGNSITVAASGTYNATCTVNNCVSIASELQTITVNPIPNAPTISGNTSICSGNSTILTASDCAGTVIWSNGVTANNITVSVAGTYNATCTVNNCVSVASETKTVVVNAIPVAPTVNGNTAVCQGLTTTLTASGCAGTVTWNTGATGNTVSASVGTYTATCTENSCVSSASSLHTITENGLPTITLSAINSICNAATNFELAYTAITNNPDKYSLTSTMPDFVAVAETNLSASPVSIVIPSGKTGTHSFTLNIKNSATGCSKSQTFTVTILPVLVGGSIEVSSSTINCAGYNAGEISSVSLASGGKTAYTYQWQSSINGIDFTDITTATSTVYDPAGLSQTTYYRRKVSDACGAVAYSSNIHQITIVPDPQISISSDKTTVCAGGAVNFSQTILQAGTGTCTTTWKSSASMSMTSPTTEGTGSALLLNFSNTGTTVLKKYIQATYECSVGSCNNAPSNVIEITINPNPSVPTVSGGGTICSGSSTTLTASGCNGTILWSNGAMSTNISVNVAGSYTSTCVNSCGTSVASNEIVVNITTINPPVLSGITTVCSGQSATLTATGCAGIVVWSNASSGTSITVLPSTTTSYTATCTANSCTSISSEAVVVTVAPSIDFTIGSVADLCNSATTFSLPYTLTLGSPDKYTLTSTMAGFTSITDGNLGTSPISVTIPSGQTGTFSFTLTLKISATGCSKSQTFTVTILPVLVGGSIEVSSSTINCAGYNAGEISSVSLASGGKTAYTYQWQSSINGIDFTDITTATSTVYDPAGLSQTTYYRRKVSDACGAVAYSSNIHQITIVPDPQISISSDKTTVCAGGVVNFSQTILQVGTGTCTTTWKSSTSVSMTSATTEGTGSALLLNFSNTGTTVLKKYIQATYECSVGSCNNAPSNVIEITINPNPSVPTVSGGGTICSGSSTTLTASGCNGTILWSNGAMSTSINVSTAGSYSAVCTNTCGTSAASNEIVVDVTNVGVVNSPTLTSVSTSCIVFGANTNIVMSADCGIDLPVWYRTGSQGEIIPTDFGYTKTFLVNSATIYYVGCGRNGCLGSMKIPIEIKEYPNITNQPKNEADCNGNSVTFSVLASSATSYQWQRKIPNGTFTDISNAISNSLTISNVGSETDPNQTEYRVVVSNGNCSVTSTVAVLTVNSVVGSLADQTICDGGNISFNLSNIVISGSIQGYQWQRRVGTSGTWNDIVGATTTTLIINAVTNADEQYYRCKVNFTAGSSTCARYTTEDDTNGAKLTVLVASTPTITGVNKICKGTTTTLTANNCEGIIAWSSGQSTLEISVSPTVNASYTVSCTSTQCGFSATSALYLVTVDETPQPEIITYDVITPATLVFAARTTVSNATLTWYNRATGGTATTSAPSFSAVGTYTYWVTQTDPITGCESVRLPIIAKVLDYFHITQQPANQVDCKGNSVYLGVVAVGPTSAFTYQWQRKRPNESEFINLVEETNGIRGWYAKTMVVSNVGDVDNPNQTQYRCIVSSNGQSLTSEISTLTVNSLQGSMPNLGICVGATNEFNLQNYFTITGDVMSYQWQTRPGTSGAWTNLSDGNGISGSDKIALKFTNATYEQGVYYRCLVKFNTQGFECTEPTDAAKLIVSGFPPAPSVSNVFYCQNSSAIRLKVDSPIQNLVWYSQETGGVGNTTAPTPNTSVAGVFRYYVADRTDEGCEGPRATINVEVGATPPAPKNTTPISVNDGNVLTFSAEGTPAENQVLRWYTSPTITTFSTTAPTFTVAGTYTRYVAQVSAFGCVGPRTTITATIIPSLKFTKQPISQADCDGNSVTFSVTATAPSTFTYQWQRQKPNETSFTDLPNENANTLKISNIGNNENPNLTKYRCIIKDGNNTAISEEATLTVNQILGTLATMSLCDGKASKLTFNSLTITGNIAQYQWQKKVGTAYTDIPTSLNGESIINEIGTYRGKIIFVVDKTTTCNRTTDDLKVEVKPSPVAPQVTNQSACQSLIFDITKAVVATNPLLWYESAADTTADKITPKVDVSKLGKTTYFVSQINAFGCESERKSFDVVVSSIPEKPITSNLIYCRNAPSLALVATTSPQNQVIWYASLTAKDAFGQIPTPNTKTDGETIYFAAAKNAAGCESERVPLKVSVAPCIATFANNFNNCLQVSADSVKGNQWFDLYDKTGRLYASVNPNGLNLGKVSISIRHYGQGSAAIPATKNDTKLMARYVDFQSSLLNEFPTDVSLRIYYLNDELNDYKIAANLPNLTINDFNIVHYDGIREDCGFENNDNFVEGESYVIYKNVTGNQIAKDFFYLQFDVNEFSENGATANDFTEITFSGKETENQTVQLNWESKYEIKAEKYILERSEDCKNFAKIGEIKANGTSSVYENIDFQPFAGKSCYRLVYIDKDGTKKYLDAIDVNFTNPAPICSVFPNPWTKGDEISLYLRNIKEKEIKLYDMLGQEFSFSMNKNESKVIKIRPDVHLSKGIHFVVVVGEDGKKCVQKVVINP